MRALLLALPLLAACRAPARAPARAHEAPADPFAWTLGTWRGTRTEAATGAAEPMSLRVRPVLGGAGRLQELEVTSAGGVYRGLHVVLFEPDAAGGGRWVSHYGSAVRGRLTPLACVAADEPAVWRSIAPERTRESRLTEWHPAPDRWRREQAFSDDGGTTWTVLFVDELERVE